MGAHLNVSNITSEESGHIKLCQVFNDELLVIKSLPSNEYFKIVTVQSFLSIILVFSTVLLNLVTIITLKRSRQLMKSKYNFLVYLQSILNFGIGLTVTPLFSVVMINELMGKLNCTFHLLFLRLCLISSALSIAILSAMNYERYACIVHPLYHRVKVTKKKLAKYIAAVSSLSFCVSIASLQFGFKFLTRYISSITALHLLATVYFYLRIFTTARVAIKQRNCPGSHIQVKNAGISKSNEANEHKIQENCSGSENMKDNEESRRFETTEAHNESTNPSHQDTVCSPKQNDQQKKVDDLENVTLSLNAKMKNPQEYKYHSRSFNNNRAITSGLDELKSENGTTQIEVTVSSGPKGASKSTNSDVCHENEKQDIQNYGKNHRTNLQSSSERMPKQKLIKNLKLTKACLIVVVSSLVGFLAQPIFSLFAIDKFDLIVLANWCLQMFLMNASFDSLVFFWRIKILRNEASKTIKKICCG